MNDPAAPKIRRGSMPDLPRIAELFDAYRQFYGQAADPDGARAFLRERLQTGDSVVLIAERDRRFLGFAQLYASFSATSMKRVWSLSDLFVAPAYRRGGVGRVLVAASEDLARATGAQGLVLVTQKTNETAKALYEARGWKRDDALEHYRRSF